MLHLPHRLEARHSESSIDRAEFRPLSLPLPLGAAIDTRRYLHQSRSSRRPRHCHCLHLGHVPAPGSKSTPIGRRIHAWQGNTSTAPLQRETGTISAVSLVTGVWTLELSSEALTRYPYLSAPTYLDGVRSTETLNRISSPHASPSALRFSSTLALCGLPPRASLPPGSC
ncbi:hypothetical protein CTAM01_13377 [Colletotrichum tamarilloi]|uniref:Uncharacterized protein n=1 Tax=Colletotrichum tamarilloi TaxID=1209934 RepID=A0ABQ9QSF4_9PEZI|nr:uncharacterized protein CTAM01_13377 [Colletotrichum tamarilloi]KAK1483497.1 hypothetical protein CTAM01_13377 [Colletotrichum tamarilloi]